MKTKGNNEFMQGYLCAVATLITMHDQVETSTRELFVAGAGKFNAKKLIEWGIDPHDIEVLTKHKKEL